MLRGISVSPGVVVGPAWCLDEVVGQHQQFTPGDLVGEVARFNDACDQAANELSALIEKVSFEIGEREAAIFRAHLFMLRDRALLGKVKHLIIEGQLDAATALTKAVAEYEELFARIQDEYLHERLADLRDVADRVIHHLTSSPLPPQAGGDRPVILVAEELFPSQTVGFTSLKISGIVTERGGATSHAAIIARSMGIPAVSGIADLMRQIRTGDQLALDAREGSLIVNPGPEAESAFRKLQREFFDFKDHLIENRDQSAVTADGHSIELLANVNNAQDARNAAEAGARGVGLYRTEYLFLSHPSIPDEEEQYQAYREVLEASPQRRLTIRTLDLGGDKSVPYLNTHREGNPFMGWRSIRMSIEHPDFFRRQIRAILRAGQAGEVRLLFPMVTTVEEVRRVNRIVWQAERALQSDGIELTRRLSRGVMIEIPAAAICIDHIVEHVDFISIGTNDLVQYLMAADRDNPKVAHLCDPLSPAVLRLLKHVIAACNQRKVSVTVCGEMAGRPRCVLVLLALGLRSFSMSPAVVPIVKELVNSVRLRDLEGIGDEVLRRRSAHHIRRFLDGILKTVNPRMSLLEFK